MLTKIKDFVLFSLFLNASTSLMFKYILCSSQPLHINLLKKVFDVNHRVKWVTHGVERVFDLKYLNFYYPYRYNINLIVWTLGNSSLKLLNSVVISPSIKDEKRYIDETCDANEDAILTNV